MPRPKTRDTAQSAALSGSWNAQGARKIDFGAFESALPLLAEQKGVSAEEVRRCIVLSEGPRRNNSVTPDFVRLHDDKTTFTGASLQLDTEPNFCLLQQSCRIMLGPEEWHTITVILIGHPIRLSLTSSDMPFHAQARLAPGGHADMHSIFWALEHR